MMMSNEWDRCLLEAEEYDVKMSRRKCNKQKFKGQHHTGSSNTCKRVERKMQRQCEEKSAQLLAKKRNSAARRCDRRLKCDNAHCYIDDSSYYYDDNSAHTGTYEREYILPATQVGIGEGAMYQRLLEILDGAEILPEDYDILLLLDENNVRPTLDETNLSNMPVLAVASGGNGEPTMSREDLVGEGCCLICMQPFADMESGRLVRRLPCNHMFCKDCIDHWLSSRSNKCPDLACYWNSSGNSA
mmetsp:Transcript_18343/g.39690  ORF Transcript_18343/g.39690 Transcript_18343/m.39690 type:complete len:244 (+) Transcript_18343:181-912(+)